MKANIHPDYHEVTVVMTDGTEYKTRTTWGKPGDTMRLDIDCLSHPAWKGGTAKITEKGQLSKFEKRFGNFLTGSQKKDESPVQPAVEQDVPEKEPAAAAAKKKKKK